MSQYNKNDEMVFIDTEVDPISNKVVDVGAIRTAIPVCSVNGRQFHSANIGELGYFINVTV